MNRKKFLINLTKVVFFFEILISLLLFIGIIISIPDIIKYYISIFTTDAQVSVGLFREFLSHILLLVIAMEFIILMVAHTDSKIIHLIILVIARKMLVVSGSMTDLLIGVIALTILFLIRKFLTQKDKEEAISQRDNTFSASAKIEEINNRYNLNINSKGYNSLGGLVSNLFTENSRELEIGEIIDDGKYIFEIEKMSNGVIEEISIHNLK